MKIIQVVFYRSTKGVEPVKEWLLSLDKSDIKKIGQEIKTVEFGWPLGMPLVRKLDKMLWEVRVAISNGRIARVLFTVVQSKMVLLHGFIKKQQKTPTHDLKVATNRLSNLLTQ